MRVSRLVTKSLRDDPPEARIGQPPADVEGRPDIPGGGGGLLRPAPGVAVPP